MTADLVVVGGGPVGLVTALEAARAGLEVVVVEPRDVPVDKACGEGLMPGALEVLDRLGIEVPGAPIRGFRYADERVVAEHRFRGPAGRGVRRPVLHAALAAALSAHGVPLLRARVERLEQDARGVDVAGIRARYVAGADGLHSTVRRLAGLEGRAARRPRYGLRRHWPVTPWTDLVEVHWRPGFEVYVTPVGPAEVGVAVLGARGLDLTTAVAACAPVAERLAGARPADAVRGAGPLRQRSTARVRGRIALVGDAAGYVDALTGEGLAVGFASARALVAAVAADDLASYERAWRRTARAQRLVTEGVLRLATSPLRRAVVPIARAVPPAFGTAVDLLAGTGAA
ncbi:FAD-dependent oxidoreductase [Amnibacterium sp. CER49]|uniref:NAD(P)/FAD-dependent oxidoreductase n=1 Tax=Amnibacterium sp. CER49 TaxID=3039161 RepID=UPI0032663527